MIHKTSFFDKGVRVFLKIRGKNQIRMAFFTLKASYGLAIFLPRNVQLLND